MAASTHPQLLALLFATLAVSLSAAERAADPVVIANGEPFSVQDYLVPGKMVVFGFVSDFSPPCPCKPCHDLGDPFKALHEAREDVVVVKVDINREGVTKIDWSSPVAQQYGLRRLPHFIVYGPDGEVLAEDDDSSDAAPGRDMVHDMLVALPAHGDGNAS
jgi:alkyl hydroperoxide reductase subunit AhpC